jgi:putative membrane protein
MQQSKTMLRITITLNYIVHTCGVILLLSPHTRNLALKITPYMILLTTVVSIIMSIQKKQKLYIWFLISIIVTIAIEAIGEATGKIFGEYVYGKVLGLKILQVPILIGLNWTVISLGITTFVKNHFRVKYKFLIPILSSMLIVLFDFVMEPAATKLNFWNWISGEIPIQNYLAWGIIGMILSTSIVILDIKLKKNILIHLIASQTIFFLGLSLFL